MIDGVTLHSGVRSTVRFFRDDGPVRFRRAGTDIPARVETVVATERCTVLGHGRARIAVVEHLLAAMHALSLWHGVVIEVSADELPILDGSAAPWMAALEALGEAPPTPAAFHPLAPIHHRIGASAVKLEAGPRSLCSEIDFPHPAIGRQHWCGDSDSFRQLLPARTFGFMNEAEALRRAGLALGANLENAIVFNDEGPLRPLRFPDEPVRHKALDALGDLFLLGRPIEGKLTVTRGSHRLHHSFMNLLLAAGTLEVAP